ncbi:MULTISPECIES: DUF2155 domain-containing protein [Ascidiaceihabitans]|jgi:hypothetical protein|uniref:DUF2155 domain-containing protein n=1 Tax=Ascidiaceihabitans donghaensis TaxID=1510460 RepID=A0A2R8BFZ1_9RHOB|nr:DUF2155 domain-containing protein [Ascidiaceihabitans donghaensis]SPH21980.1 hypothetical protein ASD8599_02727 [Ascidiaceihabitans donghaensis]
MILRLSLLIVALATAGHAQQQTTSASGAVLRGLDKINGTTKDIEIKSGSAVAFGSLNIALRDCRYPVGNPSGNAFAALEIAETGKSGAVFSGWMIASAPALSAMDHSRYDVWVMRCTTS